MQQIEGDFKDADVRLPNECLIAYAEKELRATVGPSILAGPIHRL